MKTFCPVLVVPFYNHGPALKQTAPALFKQNLPVIVVNDGSTTEHTRIAKELCQKYHFEYIENAQNDGKGAAVKKGLSHAIQKGYSHVLQVDADGQHNLEDIASFLDLAQKNPTALIAGQPVYDTSVPKSRLYGRKITNFWVKIETGGKLKLDAMCGFRVYPLTSIVPLLRHIWFNRMGFDVEILVKSFLNKIKIIGKDTKIIYPKGGVSHFHAFKDNFEISCLHTCLCVYSIYKLLTKGKNNDR